MTFHHNAIEKRDERIAELETENARLREALEFYANKNNWHVRAPDGWFRILATLINGWEKAEEALQ